MNRILVVDDDPLVRQMLIFCFAREGFQVVTAHNGIEATLLFDRGETFDLIVLDILMPEMDGNAVIRYLTARGDETPLMVLSGYADSLDPDHADMVKFMSKPPVMEDLILEARKLIARRVLADAHHRSGESPEKRTGERQPERRTGSPG